MKVGEGASVRLTKQKTLEDEPIAKGVNYNKTQRQMFYTYYKYKLSVVFFVIL